MGELKISDSYLQIIIAVVLTAVITSIPWLYFNNQEQYIHSTIVSLNEKQVKSLKEQLDQQAFLNQELVNNLASIQEARVFAETELTEITAKLSQTEEKLYSLDDMDWESKYKFAMLDNETLVEEIAELEFQHEENIDHLSDTHHQLQAVKEYIEEDFIKLEFEHDELLEDEANLMKQYINDVQQFTLETESLRNDLNKKKEELKKQQQLVSKLQNENINYKSKIAQKKKEAVTSKEESQSKITPADNKITGNNAKAGSYRTARIRSLSAAMLNRNSTDRRNILVSVIPNIPNGVSGIELSSLVQGMDSADILSVIQSTTPHINRPLANEAFNQLIKSMNKKDAALASNLLAGE
jgi:chromosome segregation ATPase